MTPAVKNQVIEAIRQVYRDFPGLTNDELDIDGESLFYAMRNLGEDLKRWRVIP